MKGIVFDLLERAVVARCGDDAWDDVLLRAGHGGSYTTLGSYPDREFGDLMAATAVLLEEPVQDAIRWFGRAMLPALAEAYPELFSPHRDSRSFLLTLNEIIHPEVRKLYPGADVPWFDLDEAPDGTMVMIYGSKRKLCALAEGLIEAAAAHYGERVRVEQPECMLLGASRCRIEIHRG
jgi:hypothetical protein